MNVEVSLITFVFGIVATGLWIVLELPKRFKNARANGSKSAMTRFVVYTVLLTSAWTLVTVVGSIHFVNDLEKQRKEKTPTEQKRDADAVRDSFRIQ